MKEDEMSLKETIHHSVFNHFQRKLSLGTGRHIFDFLGGATDVAFKKGWERYALQKGTNITPQFPQRNEHYFDWVALLYVVLEARGVLRMAELGAGYGPWLVRGALASRQCSAVEQVELLGIEADLTRFYWMEKHFLDNGIEPSDHHLFHGAVSTNYEKLLFPRIDNPSEDYGVSLRSASPDSINVEVQGYPLANLLSYFTGPVDLLHMDAQGVEYEVIPANLELLKSRVRHLVIGTHVSQKRHLELYSLLFSHGWQSIMSFPRGEEVMTEFGSIRFGDGFQFWKNPEIL
jgi:FkbM family methyltransferase